MRGHHVFYIPKTDITLTKFRVFKGCPEVEGLTKIKFRVEFYAHSELFTFNDEIYLFNMLDKERLINKEVLKNLRMLVNYGRAIIYTDYEYIKD